MTTDSAPPLFSLHLADADNRQRIRKAKADVPFLVFVLPAGDRKASPIAASGLFNADKSILTVTSDKKSGSQAQQIHGDLVASALKNYVERFGD